MSEVFYSRRTPYGFINPATATDEDRFYGEVVEIEDAEQVLAIAERLRGTWAQSAEIQTRGFGSQDQAEDMAKMLREQETVEDVAEEAVREIFDDKA